MIKENSKEMLYFLIREYRSDRMDTESFIRNFEISFDQKVSITELSKVEETEFAKLSEKASRVSLNKEELEIPNMYFSVDELKKEIDRVCEILKIA